MKSNSSYSLWQKSIYTTSLKAGVLFVVYMLLFSCSQETKEVDGKNQAQALMKKLDAAKMANNDAQYQKIRTEINEEIDKNNNYKLDLYVKTFDANDAISQGNFKVAKELLYATIKQAEKKKEYFSISSCYGALGRAEYFNANVYDAIKYWKKSVRISDKHGIKNHKASIIGNLGVAYLNLGYYSMATNYFLKSKSIMDEENIRDENYWINNINIANSFLALNQNGKAKEILNQTDKNYSKRIRYLVYSNFASVYSGEKNKYLAAAYLDSSRALIHINKEYFSNQLGLEMETSLQFGFKDRLKIAIQDYLKDNNEKGLFLKCDFNKSYKMIFGKYYNDLNTIKSWEKELINDDYVSNQAYYEFLSEVYRNNNDQRGELWAVKKDLDFRQKLIDEKLKNQMQDYVLSQKNKQIQHENQMLAVKNKAKESKLNRQTVLLYMMIVFSILSFLLVVFMFKTTSKQKKLKLKEAELSKLESDLLNSRLYEYKKRLSLMQRLFSKTSLLKKQLDLFFQKIETINDPTEANKVIKSAKTDFKSFYQMHRELVSDVLSNEAIKKKLTIVKERFPELNSKEIKVIEYILEDFSSSEIAVLLERSVKNIEFMRTSIRKKLQIPSDKNIYSFVSSF